MQVLVVAWQPTTLTPCLCMQALVIGRLADTKPEVRNLASATLSGLIKVLHQDDTNALRASLQADAKRLFSRRVRKRVAPEAVAATDSGATVKGGADASLLEKQGCLQVSSYATKDTISCQQT